MIVIVWILSGILAVLLIVSACYVTRKENEEDD